jgi:hypothetical protein
VGFEPTISVLERAKTVRALDRAATAIGKTVKGGKGIKWRDKYKETGKRELEK